MTVCQETDKVKKGVLMHLAMRWAALTMLLALSLVPGVVFAQEGGPEAEMGVEPIAKPEGVTLVEVEGTLSEIEEAIPVESDTEDNLVVKVESENEIGFVSTNEHATLDVEANDQRYTYHSDTNKYGINACGIVNYDAGYSLLKKVNNRRSALNKSALVWDNELEWSAIVRTIELAIVNGSVRPNGEAAVGTYPGGFTIANELRYSSVVRDAASEKNVIGQTVYDSLASSSSNLNIMQNGSYTRFGAAIARVGNYWYAVELFGTGTCADQSRQGYGSEGRTWANIEVTPENMKFNTDPSSVTMRVNQVIPVSLMIKGSGGTGAPVRGNIMNSYFGDSDINNPIVTATNQMGDTSEITIRAARQGSTTIYEDLSFGDNTSWPNNVPPLMGKRMCAISVNVLPALMSEEVDCVMIGTVDTTYTGQPRTPDVMVTFISSKNRDLSPLMAERHTNAMVAGQDYELSWSNNTNAGTNTATVTIIGKGDFTGRISRTFSISPAQISSATLTAPTKQKYTGSGLTPKPQLTFNGAQLREGTDYSLGYSNNIDPGTATITIRGKGNFTGSSSCTFEIERDEKKGETPVPTASFADVSDASWYAGVVGRSVSLGLFNGYGNGNFGPNDRVTRGQVAVILWNMAGGPAARPGVRDFPDVAPLQYFYRAVRWASSAGVVSGYGDGRFGPNDDVTREQLAAMLANYSARVAGKAATGSAADFASMSDRAKVSGWAAPAVGWCFRNKILSGSGGKVLPQGNASRAEAAKMVVGLHDLLS